MRHFGENALDSMPRQFCYRPTTQMVINGKQMHTDEYVAQTRITHFCVYFHMEGNN